MIPHKTIALVLAAALMTACGADSAHSIDAGDDGADADADNSTACTPTGDFTGELVPVEASNGFDASALHVSNGIQTVLVSHRTQAVAKGAINTYTRSAPLTWARSSIGTTSTWLTPDVLAVTPDASLCVAYMAWDGSLHVTCDGSPDRTVAPTLLSSLAIARLGTTTIGLVYKGQNGALGDLLWQPFNGGDFDGNPGPVELIDDDYGTLGASAIVVDAAGDPHVVYEALPNVAPGRFLYHAVRQNGTWTRELIDEDTKFDSCCGQGTLTVVMDGDQPAVAYGHSATNSLRLARRTAAGTFDVRTLVATDPGFEYDSVGKSVALQRDCAGRLLVVYHRAISTDVDNIGLAYARITPTGLADERFLPTPLAPGRFGYLNSLSFYVDATGHQAVSANLLSGYAAGTQMVYFASR